jgi:hypothetical protein
MNQVINANEVSDASEIRELTDHELDAVAGGCKWHTAAMVACALSPIFAMAYGMASAATP